MKHTLVAALALGTSLSLALGSVTPAGAQSSPAPASAPAAAPSPAPAMSNAPASGPNQATPAATAPATTAPAGTAPATNGGTRPSTTTTGTGGASGATRSAPTGTRGGAAEPPPPLPAVLPPVPNIEPTFSAKANVVPNGDLVGVTQQPFVGIALPDVIGMALSHSTDLALALSNERIARYQIVAAQGAYDVRFNIVPSYQHAVTPVVSLFDFGPGGTPVTQDTTAGQAFLSALTPSGGQARVGTTAARTLTSSVGALYNETFATSLQASLSQPLLRGRRSNDVQRAILLARAQSAQQISVALGQVSQSISNVADTYWNLVSAWRNVAIQEEGLRQATAQAASNERLARRGAIAPSDIVEANTQVDVFQDNVFSAIQNVQRLQNQLKSLILADPADPVWRANLVPTTSVAEVPREPGVDELIASAIRNRPEIAGLRAQRDASNANLAFASDQLKPQLDVGVGYTTNGFAGQLQNLSGNPLFAGFGNIIAALNAQAAAINALRPGQPALPPAALSFPPPPSYQTGKLGQSYTNALNNRYPTYSASLTFSVPLGNNTAKADYEIAREQSRQVAVNEVAVLQRLRAESVNAIQGLRETQYRLVSARNARIAAERVLLAEQRRFAAGTSTTFLVLQRQLDVANQRGRELQAQTDVNQAAVELNRVGGTIFTQYGIDASRVGGTALDAAPVGRSVLPPVGRP